MVKISSNAKLVYSSDASIQLIFRSFWTIVDHNSKNSILKYTTAQLKRFSQKNHPKRDKFFNYPWFRFPIGIHWLQSLPSRRCPAPQSGWRRSRGSSSLARPHRAGRTALSTVPLWRLPLYVGRTILSPAKETLSIIYRENENREGQIISRIKNSHYLGHSFVVRLLLLLGPVDYQIAVPWA